MSSPMLASRPVALSVRLEEQARDSSRGSPVVTSPSGKPGISSAAPKDRDHFNSDSSLNLTSHDGLTRVGNWELVNYVACGSLAKIYRARPVGSSCSSNRGGEDERSASEEVSEETMSGKAWDLLSTAPYALKILREECEGMERAVELLRREVEVGRQVVHPHLVPVLSAGLRRSPYYLVMPWLEGATLERRLADRQTFDLPQTLWIVRQTAEALGGLHRAEWMHGDIKPGNMMISPSGHVTLLDLNFARRKGESGAAVDRCILGTFYYIAPELLTSSIRADIRSDIYSLGVVFYEMLAGRRPFESEDLAELASQHLQEIPPDLKEFAPHLPDPVIRLVRQMTAKDPMRRPQSPEELTAELIRLEIDCFSERYSVNRDHEAS